MPVPQGLVSDPKTEREVNLDSINFLIKWKTRFHCYLLLDTILFNFEIQLACTGFTYLPASPGGVPHHLVDQNREFLPAPG
jgi:hypothetical protein